MSKFIRSVLTTFSIIILAGFSSNLYSQAAMADVVSAFNSGVSMMKINPDAAIVSFEKAIALADEVGEEADDLRDQASKQIPKMYWETAKTLTGKKDYDGAIAKLDACIKTSNEVGDKAQASRANNTALSILNAQGSGALNDKEYTKALGYFDSALEREDRYVKAYLGKVLAYDGLLDYDKMEEVGKIGLEKAKAMRDTKTSGDIEKKMRGTFFNNAQESMASKDYSAAIKNISKSIEYGNSSSLTYYQLGLAYEGVSNWSEAVASFNKSLELELGSDSDKAKLFFELGKCYQELEDTLNACASYKRAMFGEFEEAAKYQIENVLQCSN
jgi:tetratricopeptide (TPR) repeat protein